MKLIIMCRGSNSLWKCDTQMTPGDKFTEQDGRVVLTYMCRKCGNYLEIQIEF